ncbi:DHFRcoamplified protein [Acanthamoeba castellanii str. Neff]|uniref:DHFRcoamplified protein n=1 Tax=Acanthamoeba castellanii (strain ATCC 30010 / Neff) TaxID=1257118 RepID=L8H8P2_ACACF|nr:DHFRcoamplified protein [Acanthamoeba castellanii str. Neff]ELR21078.1 DHFRcoamplified protein [Acanthamoeba castellanii str. Neff]
MQPAREVGWAHAANDRLQLRDALGDDRISMIEADVMFRSGNEDAAAAKGAGVPVMAHPPSIPPDAMPFEAWFDLILEHNRSVAAAADGEGTKKTKGVKLDFKSFAAVAPCLAVLVRGPFGFPVWLNADVLPGPASAAGRGVVLGWTTGYPTNERDMAGYTADMIDAMLALVDAHVREGTHVTFPLQLWYAHRSWPQVERLLARQSCDDGRQKLVSSTITLWGEEVASIRQWVEATAHYLDDRIYVDLVPAAATTARV